MEFPSFNHHNHNNRYVTPPNNFSDNHQHPNIYHHHLVPQVHLPTPPPISYPNLPPPPSLPVPPPPPSYNPHRSHFTFLDPQNPSFLNHNRSSPPPRFYNRSNYRIDSRSDPHSVSILPQDNHHRLYPQSENYYASERLIPSSRFRDDNNNIDGYASRDVLQEQQGFRDRGVIDRYASSGSVMNIDKSTGFSSRNLERIWDHHGGEDPKWVMKGKKKELCDDEYKSNKVNTRVREGREEFKQVQKKSVLLRIGKPNNTSRNRNHDQHFSKPHLVESNNTTSRGNDKDRDHTGKDSSLYFDQKIEQGDREHSPVELDVSFKSNALVAKAVVTPSSPMSDNNKSQRRNRKAKRVSEFDSPLSKFSPSSSEKPPKQLRNKDSVNGSLSGRVLDQGGGSVGSNGPLSFRLRKKRKLRNLGSNAFDFQLAGKDDKSVKGEENIKNNSPPAPIPFPTLEEIISIEVDKSSQSMIPEKDGSEVENGDFSTENKNLNAHKLSIINDGLGIDLNQQPSENEISLNLGNDTQMVSTDVKMTLDGSDISSTSGQDQIEIQKFHTESHGSFDAANSLCNGSVKMQEMSITADMNSLDTCSDEIIIVSPENSDAQGFVDVVSRKEDESQLLEGTSKFPEDVSKESQNAVIVAEDNKIFSSGEIYAFGEKHENVINTVTSVSTSVETITPDQGEPGTDVPLSSIISACDTGTVDFVTDSQVLTSELTDDKTISNLSIPMNDKNIYEKSVLKDSALVNGPESCLENSRTSIKPSLLEVTKTISSASQGSTTKLQGSNLSMTKLGSVSAVPRVFTGRSTPPVFTNSRVNNPAKPRTWHRSSSNPPPPKQMGQNSYIRSGNTLVRKSAPVTAVTSVPPASRSSVYQLNPSGPIEIRNTPVNSSYSRTGGSSAPVVRPNTPPLSGSTKLPDCPTYSRDLPSSPLEHMPGPEDQNGTSSSFESQKTLDEGGAGKKIQYVKPKSNQLVAASSTDQPIQDILSSDGYYKRRKNQLIRTSDVPKVSKINIKRQSGKGISKKYKHLRFPSVWTLSSQSSRKDGVSLHQKLRPHLFPWKRSRNWGNVASISASIPSNSSSLSISGKLLLSRKRETIYTRSKHGFSLRMSKLLSVGGSSLKWSKSIEKNSKRANEAATLAVAAAQQKKREQHGSSETKSRNNLSRDRIFRIGLVRYKMDPSRRTLQRISDEEPSTSMQSKEEIRKSYVPKRLKIGHDEYVRIGNGNQLVRNPKRRTRIFANEKVRWSLHTARSRLAKKKKYCQFFTRFGKCNKDDGKCPYIHDSSKIAVCTKFLSGSCSNHNCKLTHKVIPERMQDCSYFLQGLCSNKDCPYRHVNVNSAASICEGFLKGFCADGNECRKKHTYACPVFKATGACSHGTKCKLHHPRNLNMGLKRKQQHSVKQHQKNGRGRYFGSIISAEAMQISEKHHVKDDDDEDILCQEGKFTDFIDLGFNNEEAEETMSDQRTMLVSEPSGLGAPEFDDLIKPIGIMKKTVFDSPSEECDLIES